MEVSLGELIEVKIQLKTNCNGFEKARVVWIFTNGEIRGGRITISKYSSDGLWAQLPKYKTRNNKFVNIVKTNLEIEKWLCEKALKEYIKQLNKETDDLKNEDEINLDDLDI